MLINSSNTIRTTIHVALIMLLCGPVFAQEEGGRDRGGRGDGGGFRRGGGFGGGPGGGGGGFPTAGRRGGGGGILGEIQNEAVRSEINLTEDQLEKLREIGESTTNRDQFGDIFDRMRSAESDEERNAIREEIRAKMEETRSAAEEKMKEVLSEDQYKRLDQIRLHRGGTRSLGREDVQADLGLNDQQKQQLEALNEERGEKFRELGFQASEEERDKLREEYDAKALAILNEEQKGKWKRKTGTAPT